MSDDNEDYQLREALLELAETMQRIIDLSSKELAEEYYQGLISSNIEQGRYEHLIVLKELAIFFK